MRTSSIRRTAAASLAGLFALGLSLGVTSPAFAGDKPKNDNHGGGEARPWSGPGDDDSEVPDPNGDADNQHPSGKDRHEDKGAQGHSNSNPDGGGADKPYEAGDGTGGVDLGDQDGNNGCGNDDDFEDDNNGNCGGPKRDNPPAGEVEGENEEEVVKNDIVVTDSGLLGSSTGATVMGVQFDRAAEVAPAPVAADTTTTGAVAGAAAEAAASPAGAQVQGVQFSRAADLARTGSSLVLIALAGLALVLFGFIIKRSGRRSSI